MDSSKCSQILAEFSRHSDEIRFIRSLANRIFQPCAGPDESAVARVHLRLDGLQHREEGDARELPLLGHLLPRHLALLPELPEVPRHAVDVLGDQG